MSKSYYDSEIKSFSWLHDSSVLLWVTHLWRVHRHCIKGNATPFYLVPSYFCQAQNHCLPKLKLLQFPLSPLTCFMFVISGDFYKQSFYELTMRYSILRRSIIPELFLLSFSATEEHRQMKKVKLRVVVDQPLQERRLLWGPQDHWRLVWPLFLLSCTTYKSRDKILVRGIDL
jgi:hypothetical protein